jgi:hypothetical protein
VGYATTSNWIVKIFLFVLFEVLTAVIMNSSIFWEITPCSLLKCNRSFVGTYRLPLQGSKNKPSKIPVICSIETSVDFQRNTWPRGIHFLQKKGNILGKGGKGWMNEGKTEIQNFPEWTRVHFLFLISVYGYLCLVSWSTKTSVQLLCYDSNAYLSKIIQQTCYAVFDYLCIKWMLGRACRSPCFISCTK